MSLVYGKLPDDDRSLLEFQEFHNLLFKGTNASFDWLDWYFRQVSLDRTTTVYTLRDDRKIVGSWCVEPKVMMLNGKFIKVGRCFSVGIHPDYRRRNLFVELSKFAIEQERALKRFEYVLGFPQVGKPVIEAHLKSGWDHVQDIDIFSCTPSNEDKTGLKSVRTIFSFEPTDYGPIFEGSFIESADYRTSRWHKHPDNHYVCLGINESYVVIKPYAGHAHILDVHGEHEHVRTLLRATKTLAHRHAWSEVTIWNALNEHHGDDICAAGFRPGSTKALSIDLLAVKINATDDLKFTTCHFQMGSEEGY